jgi:hypothetical protein
MLRKLVRQFGHADFRGNAVRAGFAHSVACAGPLAEKRLIWMVLANEAAVVAARAFAHLNAPFTRAKLAI